MCFQSLDSKISKKLPLTTQDVLSINSEAVHLHQRLIDRKDDNELYTGTDDFHRDYITFYTEVNEFIKTGQPKLDLKETIAFYQDDADNHLRLVNEGLLPGQGDVKWNMKWYHRWLAVAEFIEGFYLNE